MEKISKKNISNEIHLKIQTIFFSLLFFAATRMFIFFCYEKNFLSISFCFLFYQNTNHISMQTKKQKRFLWFVTIMIIMTLFTLVGKGKKIKFKNEKNPYGLGSTSNHHHPILNLAYTNQIWIHHTSIDWLIGMWSNNNKSDVWW